MVTKVENFIDVNELEDIITLLDIKDSPSLFIQVFCAFSDYEFIRSIQDRLNANLPKAILIGSTSDGVIENSNIYAYKKSVIVFTSFNDTVLNSALIKQSDSNNNSFNMGKELSLKIVGENTKVIISFTDGINTNGEEYVNGLNSINSDIIISGGLAGDNGNLKETFVFDNNEITNNGAVAVSLNNLNLQVSTDYSFNWTPIGKKMKITKSIKNRVYEIDNTPIIEIYSKYLGDDIANSLPSIGIEFPLIFEDNGVQIGRAVLAKHDDNSLTFAGNIKEGKFVRFGVSDIEMILSSSDNHIRNILNRSKYEVESIFIYSCMARRRFAGHYLENEMKILSNQAPTAGFFTYGEFFKANGKCELLNETTTTLAISESKKSITPVLGDNLTIESEFGVNFIHAISHLANSVSRELEDLNNSLESRIKKGVNVIYKNAYYDKLTKLPNRLKLLIDLDKSVGKTLVLINIDEFSVINDFYGHKVGDKVLIQVAKLLFTTFDDDDEIVYKLPSDEFVLICCLDKDERDVEDKIQKIFKIINKSTVVYKSNIIRYSLTISSAKINGDNNSLINANMAMKRARERNIKCLLFNHNLMLSNNHKNNIKVANELRLAIEDDRIIVFYQPIFNALTQKVDKYECLTRLKKEDGEILLPLYFLGIAQKIKLYPEITKIMISKSFKKFSNTNLNFSLNLEFEDILNDDISDFIIESIQKYSIANQLTFELLETQELNDLQKIKNFIKKIKDLGAKIAIDDFGSGYSNFEYLIKMDSDYLKIDGSLIKNIDRDENSRVVVNTIISFAKSLNMTVVAEYVHSEEIFKIVKELGVDLIQGFYLGEPNDYLLSEV